MKRMLFIGVVIAGLFVAVPAGAGPPEIHVKIFARTGMSMDSIVWTGTKFVYVVNTENTVFTAPPAGMPLTQLATMPKLVEETRCLLSPGTHGFPAGVFFCHSPDNKIYEINGDGSSMKVFATLPAPPTPAADGALTFDNVGRFGYRLVAATGRSGAATPSGGVVYTIDAAGKVQEIGGYKGPGGADEVVIAPAGFGTIGGEALLSVDGGAAGGGLVAMDSSGHSRKLVAFSGDGPNPIVPIPKQVKSSGAPSPGIYITDDISKNIYFVAASELAPYAGDLFVTTEVDGEFWIVEPKGGGVRAFELANTLTHKGHGIEQAIYVP
jgi:hypothetical protein